jgi:hypothetical protein
LPTFTFRRPLTITPNFRLPAHLKKQFVIPPEASAAFVANMQDALDVIAGGPKLAGQRKRRRVQPFNKVNWRP